VCLLLDYGDFTDDNADSANAPYAQLLSTTNPAEAHGDFDATRLNGHDTTSSQRHSTGSGGNTGFFQKYRIPLFAAAAAGGVLALTGAVWLVARRRRPVYRPLYDPVPVGDMPMDAACHGLRRPGAIFWSVDKPDIMHNVGLSIHPLTGEDQLVYVSPFWLRTGTRAG
jgi:hypothetical protein